MVRRFSSRPEAAPCCGVLVRAALVDKSLKRHVTITVSRPFSGREQHAQPVVFLKSVMGPGRVLWARGGDLDCWPRAER